MFTVPERVCRTASGELVAETDLEAAFLLYPEGTQLSDEEADRSGVAAYFATTPDPEPAEPDVKMAPPVANKMAAPPADKAPKPGDDRAEQDTPPRLVTGRRSPEAKG